MCPVASLAKDRSPRFKTAILAFLLQEAHVRSDSQQPGTRPLTLGDDQVPVSHGPGDDVSRLTPALAHVTTRQSRAGEIADDGPTQHCIRESYFARSPVPVHGSPWNRCLAIETPFRPDPLVRSPPPSLLRATVTSATYTGVANRSTRRPKSCRPPQGHGSFGFFFFSISW